MCVAGLETNSLTPSKNSIFYKQVFLTGARPHVQFYSKSNFHSCNLSSVHSPLSLLTLPALHEHIRQVHDFDFFTLLFDETVEVQQTTKIGGDDGIGAGSFDGL